MTDGPRDAQRPLVRVNQLGYRDPGRCAATVILAAPEPRAFRVVDDHGRLLTAGSTLPAGLDPESGLGVHRLTFALDRAPTGPARLEVEGVGASHPFALGPQVYDQLLLDAVNVFGALHCVAATGETAGGAPDHDSRRAGPSGRAVPAWTGPDAAALYPGWSCPGRFDVSGGWYDAGDFGKYATSGALALWQLLGVLDARVPDGAVWLERLRAECRWQLAWLLRMRVPAGPLAGMVFHRVHGTTWPPFPCSPAADPTERVLHRPSTQATYALAAVAALAARTLAEDEAERARWEAAARDAFSAAEANPELCPPDDHARFGGGAYADDDPTDDRYWAAAELWVTTGEERFRRAVEASPWHARVDVGLDGFDVAAVAMPARLALARHPELPGLANVAQAVVRAGRAVRELQRRQPWGQPYAPRDGWEWGSNGLLLTNAIVMAEADRLDPDNGPRDGVVEALDYLLGRNALGQSYVVGYGAASPRRVRARQFAHGLDPELPAPPNGLLVGGANSRPSPDFPYPAELRGLPPQQCYADSDEPSAEQTNDFCIRWQAALVRVLAAVAADR